MKSFAYILLALACAGPLCAQRYILKDGRSLKQSEVTIKNGSLVKALAGGGDGSAEVSYPFAQVARLDWPQPDELDDTATLLAAGKADEALAKITPIYNQFAPFAALPGSWWSDAASLRAHAFLLQKKYPEAERAAREIISTAADSNDVKAAQLIIAEIQIRVGKPDIADAMLDEILRKHASADIEARALVLRGDIACANNLFEQALDFYLQVPVFYGSNDEQMPAALLGSARAYKAYGDKGHAERAYLDLINSYPDSAQAAIAKTESGL